MILIARSRKEKEKPIDKVEFDPHLQESLRKAHSVPDPDEVVVFGPDPTAEKPMTLREKRRLGADKATVAEEEAKSRKES